MHNEVTYDIRKLKQDITAVRGGTEFELSDEKVKKFTELLKEEALPDINKKPSFVPKISSLHSNARACLLRKVSPSVAIQEYLNDAVLQSWVKAGIDLHRGHREACGFCGQMLPDDLWERLDAHFNKELGELEAALRAQLVAVENENVAIKSIPLPDRASFYASNREEFDDAKREFEIQLKVYETELKRLAEQIKRRLSNLFQPIEIEVLSDNSSKLSDCISFITNLIENNNRKTHTLASDKRNACTALRWHAVAHYVRTIDLTSEEAKILALETEAKQLEEHADAAQAQVAECERQIDVLRALQKDEKQGAEKVNELLNNFFGHNGLQLVAIEEGETTGVKFQIMRGEELAYNLSEGESSLVAFCYFMAKLDDVDTKGKDLIVCIDDPISSLDSNHIFFVFSLIESMLTKPLKNADGSNLYRYKQLFISTHNLEFLKYLKKLSLPKNKHGDTGFFIIEQQGYSSKIRLMPDYLKNYITEFNYLFHQIYKCSNVDPGVEHECFYNFGNNLRKFLEAYLFYRYPSYYNTSQERLQRFFGDDNNATALTTRVSNELSHLEESFDRSMSPIEIPEIPTLAKYVLDKMYEKDPDQYNAFLESIGEEPRIALAA